MAVWQLNEQLLIKPVVIRWWRGLWYKHYIKELQFAELTDEFRTHFCCKKLMRSNSEICCISRHFRIADLFRYASSLLLLSYLKVCKNITVMIIPWHWLKGYMTTECIHTQLIHKHGAKKVREMLHLNWMWAVRLSKPKQVMKIKCKQVMLYQPLYGHENATTVNFQPA